jgi:prefoldin subunit 5
MNEQEIKNLLTVYQQKVSDLTAQTIAFEARIMNSNQVIEALNNKINELSTENEKLKKSKRGTKVEEDFS